MWKQILIGLLVSGMGGVMIFFSQQIVDIFGPVPWAESHMSSTRNMYIISGFLIIVFGMLMLFGVVPVDSQIDNVSSIGVG